MNHSLVSTEKRLITLFVGGAFIFLLIFEGFFLLSRFFFEEKYSIENFQGEIQRIESRMKGEEIEKRRSGPRFGLAVLHMNASGNLIQEKVGLGISIEEINEIDINLIAEILPGKIIRKDGVMYYKRISPGKNAGYDIYMRNSGYPLEDLFRDIIRFLALDIIILLPFYFMGRYFVRETLSPVEANMNAMSHFIHDSGHELKTPLSIISGNLQLLRDEKEKDMKLIESSIDTIESMGKSLDGLIELSNLKRPEKLLPINLLNHTQEIIKLYEQDWKKKNIEISVSIPPKTEVTIDPNHFAILFGNLLKNAIIYNRERGQISITYKNKYLFLQDTGIGMTEDDMKKMFDRFFRVDRSGAFPGSGIGLSLVDRIIRLYGWNIRAESTIGMGTTFSIKTK